MGVLLNRARKMFTSYAISYTSQCSRVSIERYAVDEELLIAGMMLKLIRIKRNSINDFSVLWYGGLTAMNELHDECLAKLGSNLNDVMAEIWYHQNKNDLDPVLGSIKFEGVDLDYANKRSTFLFGASFYSREQQPYYEVGIDDRDLINRFIENDIDPELALAVEAS